MGFALVGVAPAVGSDHAEQIRRWLKQGQHGDMSYLTDLLEERLDPGKWMPGARSVICFAYRYRARSESDGSDSVEGEPRGRIARYAWDGDYHEVVKERLVKIRDGLRTRWPDQRYCIAVDTSPVLETEHAQRAGLGWVGKHTLLIHPRLGSWMMLGEIITTLPIEPNAPQADHCGTCTRCIDACPTQCITPYQVDASRCIAYLTIETRGPIDVRRHEAIGGWVAGCDMCQEVCPFNQESFLSRVEVEPGTERENPGDLSSPAAPRVGSTGVSGYPLLEVLGWDASARQRALRQSTLKRIRLEMFKRNALIVAGNYLKKNNDAKLRQRIVELAEDSREDALVRETARVVLRRLAL
jgi:epoxyqueuosine reductase